MDRKRESCIYHRCEDGCKWCELGKTCSNKMQYCSSYVKRLSEDEAKRVGDLMQVWDFLYKQGQWKLCDIISHEVGVIKETL